MNDVTLFLVKCLFVYLVIINLTASVITIIDKRRAVKHLWRISEKTLLLFGLVGGALGSYLTMLTIRHKTKHAKFMVLLPLMIILHAALLFFLFRSVL